MSSTKTKAGERRVVPVYLETEVYERLRETAHQQRVSMSAYLVAALRAKLPKEKP